MKRILITGANSYIGTSLEAYLLQWPAEYSVDTADMLDGTWRQRDFSVYDAVFHVAGIAHRRETEENAHLYYEINRELAAETARKAKTEGVGQFVFLSSMSVYGMDRGVITRETVPHPVTHYGSSKLQAEELLRALGDDAFRVCILRPPMVYGKGCKGNFVAVLRLVRALPAFPRVNNRRSAIYIDNLCAFARLVLDERKEGLFFPQNAAYLNTSMMAKWMAEGMGKRLFLSRLLGLGAACMQPFSKAARKAFGSLIYRDTEEFGFSYCSLEAEETVRRSVGAD